MRAQSASGIDSAPAFAPLLGPATAVLTAMNGSLGGTFTLRPRRSRTSSAVGGPWRPPMGLHSTATRNRLRGRTGLRSGRHGCVVHHEFIGSRSENLMAAASSRVLALSNALTEAGFDAPVPRRYPVDIWLKLWGKRLLQSDQRADRRDAGPHGRRGPAC